MITLTCNTLTLTLRNPDFGNTESIGSTRIQRQTRGGDVVIYRDPRWSQTVILGYHFTILKEKELYDLETFFHASLGKLVTLVDYEGRTWSGIILTPNEERVQTGRELYGVGFQFQGSIVE